MLLPAQADTVAGDAMKSYLRSHVELLVVMLIALFVAAQPKLYDYFAGRPGPDVRLITAANSHDADGVREALRDGAYLEYRDDSGETPLIAAARTGDAAIVSQLLSLGSDINADDGRGRTAMSFAEMFQQDDVVRLLVQHGARPGTQLAAQDDCDADDNPSPPLLARS